MKDNEKDHILGQEVAQKLKELNIESPIIAPMDHTKVHASMCTLMEGLGLSLKDDSIQKTPQRIAKFFIDELFYGLDYENFPKITFSQNSYGYSEPVIARKISFQSTCEHHFVTINGNAYVAYIPKDRVVGLSKINRIVDFFAKRPQVQERVTLQIFHTLQYVLDTNDIAVFINAEHHCITMRGVNDHAVDNITYKFGGKFLEPDFKAEFLNLTRE
jgi:GTP cyclohydrolase I